MRVRLPNQWQPRDYQLPAWSYLENGGKLCYCIWHRRAGKDDVALHWSAVAAHLRVGNYWHMLPEASQARKAVFDAVNPHTSKRRIDEAFPQDLRETTRENEMLIRFKNGSTWQVIGSDNYDSLVGSPPIGIVFSEWALAKPHSWAYLRPILAENNGWAAFISTPRGNNHAATMFESLKRDPANFVQRLTARETSVFTEAQLESEKRSYIAELGEAAGQAMFEQEYLCSFDAANLGAIFAKDLRKAREQGRIGKVPWDPGKLVYTAWDLGKGDPTAIWFFQQFVGEVNFIDYFEDSGQDITFYLQKLASKPYRYATAYLPHDSKQDRLGAPKTIERVVIDNGYKVEVIPVTALKDQINAGRLLLARCNIDAEKCSAGLETLENYRWGYNKTMEEFRSEPLHDWASHGSSAFMGAAMSLQEAKPVFRKIRYDRRGIV